MVLFSNNHFDHWSKDSTTRKQYSKKLQFESYIGKIDSFDNELNPTEIAVIDELASSAELVMKKTVDIPIAIIRGFVYENSNLNAKELIRDDNEDFFL